MWMFIPSNLTRKIQQVKIELLFLHSHFNNLSTLFIFLTNYRFSNKLDYLFLYEEMVKKTMI